MFLEHFLTTSTKAANIEHCEVFSLDLIKLQVSYKNLVSYTKVANKEHSQHFEVVLLDLVKPQVSYKNMESRPFPNLIYKGMQQIGNILRLCP